MPGVAVAQLALDRTERIRILVDGDKHGPSRSGPARAWPLVSDRSLHGGYGVKRYFAGTCQGTFTPCSLSLRRWPPSGVV
jgi:hypothetical protein